MVKGRIGFNKEKDMVEMTILPESFYLQAIPLADWPANCYAGNRIIDENGDWEIPDPMFTFPHMIPPVSKAWERIYNS